MFFMDAKSFLAIFSPLFIYEINLLKLIFLLFFLIYSSIAPCQPGSWSRTGFEPCQLCPLNFYQDETNATDCKECAGENVTTSEGSQSAAECVPLTGESLITFSMLHDLW